VPDDFSTIQAALDGVVDGDTVIVRDGTYSGAANKNLNLGGKAIMVRSETGPENCSIDCEGDGRGFTFHSGETSGSVVSGFTITNGNAPGIPPFNYQCGGAVLCTNSSSPAISNCIITENYAYYGGGIYCEDSSSPTISNCIITNCSSDTSMGGGIYCISSSPIIIGCTISFNFVFSLGGGIYSNSCNLVMEQCTIMRNTAKCETGGGMYICGDSASSSIINNCEILTNTAAWYGGGIFFSGGTSSISNCTIATNYALLYQGGGISSHYTSTIDIANCILWDNRAADGHEIALTSSDYPSSCIVRYSDVQGGESACYVVAGCTLNWAEGNIDADPLFVSGPQGDYYLSQVAAGQGMNSPCVDAGNDSAANLGLNLFTTRTDHMGDAGMVDIGYHYPNFTTISLQFPRSGSLPFSSPTFAWMTDAGQDNVYVVDFFIYPSGPLWTTPITAETSWTMSAAIWNLIPSERYVLWRVRGADLDVSPLTVIRSDEVWWFHKP